MLFENMQALHLMKTHVVKTTPDTTLREAVDLMDIYQVSALPVVDENDILCGILAECDILRAIFPDKPASVTESADMDASIQSFLGNIKDVPSLPVSEFMSPNVAFVLETAEMREAAIILIKGGWKRMPVVTSEGQLIGTLNRVDVLQAIFDGRLKSQK